MKYQLSSPHFSKRCGGGDCWYEDTDCRLSLTGFYITSCSNLTNTLFHISYIIPSLHLVRNMITMLMALTESLTEEEEALLIIYNSAARAWFCGRGWGGVRSQVSSRTIIIYNIIMLMALNEILKLLINNT